MIVKLKNTHNTVSKTFQKNGKWTEKPTKTEILTCDCGSKYIKTRDGQITCLKCA